MATITPTAPDRSYSQRMDALKHANHVRHERKLLKASLKARSASLIDCLTDPPEWLLSMKVFDLLLATPKVGRVKASKVLRRHQISPSKTVGGLSRRQRGELIDALRGPAR